MSTDFTLQPLASLPKRMFWLDWMKTLAMFFIILGHFFPIGSKYIYIFSVQCFFIISGFLDKKEDSNQRFWEKIWRNLFYPMIIICFLNYLFYQLPLSLSQGGDYSVKDILTFLIGFLVGYHPSLGGMWFVYVLILLKIMHQYLPSNTKIYLFLFFLFPLLSVFINNVLLDFKIFELRMFQLNHVAFEILLAVPFFFGGVCLKKYKNQIDQFSNKSKLLVLFFLSAILTILCGHYNDIVYMYANRYGNYILLFLLGGFVGTALIFTVSKFLQRLKFKSVEIISKGCLIILAFHWNVEHLVKHLLPQTFILQWIYSLIILLAFVPIILAVNKYYPPYWGREKCEDKSRLSCYSPVIIG